MAKKKQESKRASKCKKLPEVYNKLLKVGAYDATHRKQLQQRAKKVQQLYKQAVDKIARAAAPSLFDADPAKEFHFSDFPALNKSVDEFIDDMGKQLQANIEDGDSDAWTLANAKNDMVVNTLASVYSLPKDTLAAWRHPHLDALQEFEERRKNGMNLSNGGSEADIRKGVWNLDQFKNELELALEQGIGQGKSAVDLSRDVRQYLKYPNKLFRRVRDKDGVLRLSKAAAAFHPGRGVYRSSYKNALRLTATENNIAYRTCDHKRWNALPFVIGQKIKTSNNHPEPDICDTLAGKYPIEFKFTGWHPFCRCYAVSILASEKELDDYCSKLEQGTNVSEYQFTGKQTQMPEAFTTWMKDNEGRIAKAKSLPYFIKDNYKDGDPAKGLRWECKNKQSTQWEPSFMNEEQYTELTRTMKITPEQHHELYDGDDVYIDSSWSRQINKELASEKVRGDIPDNFMDGDTGTIRQCKVLDAVIKANTLKEDTYVYRKVTEDWLKRDGVSFTEGNVIHEFGYTSTSAVEGNTYMSRKTVRMNIKIPKGTHAYVSENINESEIILGRNSKFLVKSVKHEGKNTIINLELQPQIVKSVKTKHEVIMENAAKRHAARTDKQVDKIQYTWDMHRLDTYNVKIDALKKKLKGSTSPNNKLNALKKREAAITDAILKHKSVAETQNLMARYEHGVEIQEAWNKILWDGFSKEQIDNCQKIENKLGILKGRRMSIEGADKQSANPNFIEKYIPKKGSGMFITIDGKRIDVIANKKWTASNENEYHVNCATCAPTYVLREFGFNIFAKGRHATKHNDDIAYGKSFSVWRNKDGSVCNQKTFKAWLDKNKYKNMTPKRYRAFFEEMTQDEGTYILNIGWKGGGGHATILKRKSDGSLVYIEPQHYYGETIGVERPIDSLCKDGGQQPGWRLGIMRVDDKIFDTDWLDIFGHN